MREVGQVGATAAQGQDEVLLGGRYRLVEQLGHGGAADAWQEVWRGLDVLLDRPVAVKILSARSVVDDADRARFREEARLVGTLSHPGIAAVHDHGESAPLPGSADPVFYLVTELVEGPTVAQLLADGALGTARTCEIVTAAARALNLAHRNGVVHRDVKPANLVVTSGGQVKVTGFGIARRLGHHPLTSHDPLTSAVLSAGTPDYLAPEVCQGEPATPRSDIYALGVVAYECLTGRRPFHRASNLAILTAQVRSAPPALPLQIPRPVAAAVMTALKKDPGRRFPSAAAFADALQPSGHGADRAASVVPVPALGGVTVRQGGAHSRAGAQASARSGAQASARSGAQAGAQAGVQAGVPDGAGRPAGRRRALPAAAAALAICAVAGLGAGARHALLDGTGPSSAQPGAVTAQVAVNAGLPTPRTSPSPASASMPVSASMPASASVSGRLGPIVVPDLSLSSVPRARARAIGAGLTVAAPVGVDHPGVRQGSVVRTDPPAGAKVAPGTRVTLYVADGLVTVPDLTGHQLADATDILQNQLRMRVAVTFVVSTADPGTVLGQDLHGHGVIPGRTVGLQVAVSVQGGSVPGGPVQTVTPAPAMPTAVTGPHW